MSGPGGLKSAATGSTHDAVMTTSPLPTTSTLVHPDAVAELRRLVSGRVAYPSDSGFQELVTGHDLAAGHAPAVVVEPLDPIDVEHAVGVAARPGVPVRSGLMLATRRLDGVAVDPDSRTVTVGAGATWGTLAVAVGQHDLLPVTTNGPSVGVVGSTLGGGVGPVARSHGFAVEHVVSLDVVGADGLTRTVGPGSDIFWALCGGRDGVGVVTSMTLRLHEATPLWGGELVWTGPGLDDALTWWHRFAAEVPESVTTSAMAAIAPDVEEVPPPLRGQAMLRVTLCAGVSDSEAVELALREAPAAAVRALGPTTVPDFVLQHGDVAPPMPTWQRGFALVDLTTETLDVVREIAGPTSGAPLLGVEVRRLGGALARGGDLPVSGRDAEWLVSIIGVPEPGLFAEVLPDVARRLAVALEPWSTGGSLLNFHGRPGAGHELDRAWPTEVFTRLGQVRAKLDPRGTFAVDGSGLAS
jgi:FAD/FMN-containing dehydrogenase